MSHTSRLVVGLIGIAVIGSGYVPAARSTSANIDAVSTLPPQLAQPLERQRTNAVQSAPVAAQQRDLLDRYCVTCHNPRMKTAGLSFDKLDIEHVGGDAETWEKVVRKLLTGQMPPVGLPRPDKQAARALAVSLEAALDRAGAAAPNPGRPTVHRLNRTEYTNSIRDILALDIDPRAMLPADDTDEYGFDNNGDVLTTSPALLARYMSAARKISRLAVGRSVMRTIETYNIPRQLLQDDRLNERLPFGTRGGAAILHNFPADGEYVIKIRLQTNNYGYVRGLADSHDFELRVDRQRIKTFKVGGNTAPAAPASFGGTVDGSPEWEKYALNADAGLEVRFPAKAGRREVSVFFVRKLWESEDVAQPRQGGWPLWEDEQFESNPGLASVTIEGPYTAQGSSDTPSRRKIFSCQPKGKGHEEACARTILGNLATRAYRRAASEGDVETLLKFYKTGASDGGFEAGIQLALERLLVSPDFLFRVENEPPAVARGSAYRVSDVELASRLSFFLWSSVPDEELLDAAIKEKLKNPSVLEGQVRRMLADPRSKALVENFAGQWLVLRNIRDVSPDPDLFPDFDENLRDAFKQETELFVDSQVRQDRSVVELLSAKYTFLNERLARHYEIPNVYGSHFRRVALNDDRRGGLLTQGSLLMVTSYPNRTSPVLRGKWLLETILGTPPPPPPPDVPALKDKGESGRLASVRERLEVHRKNAACAVCHARIDPLGFALENFDPIGRWRTTDAGAPIDSSGALPSGEKLQGVAGLRQVLLADPEQFVGNLTEKLLGYALGREIKYYDYPSVRKITHDAAAGDYHWSSIVLGIVKSTPFQMRRTS